MKSLSYQTNTSQGQQILFFCKKRPSKTTDGESKRKDSLGTAGLAKCFDNLFNVEFAEGRIGVSSFYLVL